MVLMWGKKINGCKSNVVIDVWSVCLL